MTTIHHSEDPMKLANTAIGKVLLGYDVRLDPPILTVSKARPVMPETNQEAVVTLQHIINLFPDEPDVIFAAAVAIADIATEAANNGTIVDPLMGSDFVPPSPAGTATESSTGPIQVFNDRELATVLHGLRLIQEGAGGTGGDCSSEDCDHFDEAKALTDDEIDVLCERLNLA